MGSRVTGVGSGAGLSASIIASAVIHLAVFLLLVSWGRIFPPQISTQETYYVDVVSLPAVDPQSGGPAPKRNDAGVTPPLPVQQPMLAPPKSKSPQKIITKPAPASPLPKSDETESAFAERMEQLERARESRRTEAALERLRNKVKGAGSPKSGMPGASGAEAGSRYADYIKSRLEDALKVTSRYSTKNPEVAVRLTISAEGKLSRIKVEHSSGDATFEIAVRRAIEMASEKFTPPPNRAVYENGFVFKPKELSSGTPR